LRMVSGALGLSLGGSRSSIRINHWPFCDRASRKLASAATSEPKWRGPEGEGANRPI